MRVRLLVVPAVAGVMALACSASMGGNAQAPTSAALDVSGASNAPCTITMASGSQSSQWEIGAPNPAVPDVAAGPRAALVEGGFAPPASGLCGGDAATVSVKASSGAPSCVHASRTSTQLCFVQDGCLAVGPGTAAANCPVNLTLTCAGVTLYDRVPWHVCLLLG